MANFTWKEPMSSDKSSDWDDGYYIAKAQEFHETYERLAPQFGYETRPDTKAFDPASPNGQLMIAVMKAMKV